MFEIETVPVPIPDKNRNADIYSKVHIHKPYIAVGADYYIQLRMTELVMCNQLDTPIIVRNFLLSNIRVNTVVQVPYL